MSDATAGPLPSGGYWQGRLVRLRAMRPDDDLIHLHDDLTDTEAVRNLHCGMPLPTSPTAARAFTERFAEFGAQDERVMFAIETLEGDLVGGINIHSRQPTHGTFETGSRIYRAFRGRGFGFDAKLLVLRYAFHELRFQKYVVRCIASNEAMVRHVARLGCVQEGRLRRQFFTDGTHHDELIFGLLREEFDALWQREGRRHDATAQPG